MLQSEEQTTKIGGLFTAAKHCPENISDHEYNNKYALCFTSEESILQQC